MELPEKLKFLEKYVEKVYSMKPGRVVVEVPRERIREVFSELKKNLGETGFYLATIVGTDFPDKNMFRLDYYVVTCPGEEVYVIRTWIPRDNPVVDSIIDIVPGALAGECETYDLLGIEFKGNNMLRRGFFVPLELVEKNVYPLRKDSGV